MSWVHSSIAMTERYAHATDEAKRRVVEAVGLKRAVVVKMASKKSSRGMRCPNWGGLEIIETSEDYWWPLEDSNLQPKDYESSALPLS